MRPEITLLVRCHTQAAQAGRIVVDVAPFVGEVVVAADARMTSQELAALEAARPDTLVRLPFVPPVERALAYLFGLCGGRWILRLDGDELPSRALLRALGELVADRDVIGHQLARAWLWPGLDRVLVERPWWPDHQLRLVRNEPALLSFPGYTHSDVWAHGATRLVEGPGLYHTDLASSTPEARARKAARYDAERPGLQMLGRPFNEAYYLPESRAAAPPTEPVPDEDRRALAGVFGAPAEAPAALRAGAPPLVAQAELDAAWAQRPWPPEAYRARLEVVDRDLRFAAGETRQVLVAVENHSNRALPWGEHEAPEIRLSYRWLAPGGGVEVAQGLRTPLPGPVRPRQRRLAQLTVTAPEAGEHVLEVDLVHEHVRWFEQGVRVSVAVG